MQNKSIIHNLTLKNILLLGTICSGILYTNNANASGAYYGGKAINVNGIKVIYGEKYNDANTKVIRYELENVSLSDDYSYDSNGGSISINVKNLMPDSSLPLYEYMSMAGDSWSNNFKEFKQGMSGLKSYYTDIEYNSTTKTLTFSDKLVNKSTLDAALADAGISDMSIYAKTADVADTYATKTALSEGLGGKVDTSSFNEYKTTVSDTYATKTALSEGLGAKVDTSAFNEYKTTVGNTYATKASLNDYVTTESLGTTLGGYVTSSSLGTTLSGYATTGSVYTKDESDAKYLTSHQDISSKANVGDSYTKSESDAKYLTSHQDISGKANVGDSYTKDESDAKYLTAHQDISGKANVADVYTKEQADNKFLTSADMSGYATTDSVYTKEQANNTFAAKNDVYTKSEVYTKDEADGKYALKGASYTKDEADSKFLTSADMSGYATTDSVYTKTAADEEFATKGTSYTKEEADRK